MDKAKRILITPGEPAGIGPDITVQIAQQDWDTDIIAIADPELLRERAKQINLPLNLIVVDSVENKIAEKCFAGTLKVLPVKQNVKSEAGRLNPSNASYVINTLKIAGDLCLKNLAQAVVTGPVHKEVINQAGISFTGHTEFFAELSHVKHTVMLFVVEEVLKVALVTTHLPLAKVSQAITKERLGLTIEILNKELKDKFKIKNPRILVCGLNPHAGEGGYLGREEIDVIQPVLQQLRKENYLLEGPLSADTIFTPKHLQNADAVLAMYHDQALPIVKYIGFGNAVNVTLGLPFVRTSVDHGTAIDVAGTGQADAGSMQAAVRLAEELVGAR